MKKTLLIFSLFTTAFFITACGGEKKKENIKVSSEMQDFMNNLNGRAESVTYALKQFGSTGLDDKDMDMYDLKEPRVLEANGNCYLLQCTSGLTKRKYNLCWEGGKITSIEDKGME